MDPKRVGNNDPNTSVPNHIQNSSTTQLDDGMIDPLFDTT
jgi:hypothetical protein